MDTKMESGGGNPPPLQPPSALLRNALRGLQAPAPAGPASFHPPPGAPGSATATHSGINQRETGDRRPEQPRRPQPAPAAEPGPANTRRPPQQQQHNHPNYDNKQPQRFPQQNRQGNHRAPFPVTPALTSGTVAGPYDDRAKVPDNVTAVVAPALEPQACTSFTFVDFLRSVAAPQQQQQGAVGSAAAAAKPQPQPTTATRQYAGRGEGRQQQQQQQPHRYDRPLSATAAAATAAPASAAWHSASPAGAGGAASGGTTIMPDPGTAPAAGSETSAPLQRRGIISFAPRDLGRLTAASAAAGAASAAAAAAAAAAAPSGVSGTRAAGPHSLQGRWGAAFRGSEV
ncbi:hypothetical protein VaNZ11_012950, partial [Volvox africanus]